MMKATITDHNGEFLAVSSHSWAADKAEQGELTDLGNGVFSQRTMEDLIGQMESEDFPRYEVCD